MYCPRCSQQQVSADIRFCSKCGFLMTGVASLLANDGNSAYPAPVDPAKMSPRKKGLRQGGLMIMLGTLIVPLMGVLIGEGPEVATAALIFFLGGVLRMIYALIFQSGAPSGSNLIVSFRESAGGMLGRKKAVAELPSQQTFSVDSYLPPATGNWRDTNEFAQPPSVTDATTKLLKNEDQ